MVDTTYIHPSRGNPKAPIATFKTHRTRAYALTTYYFTLRAPRLMSSTTAVVPASQAIYDANRNDRSLSETQGICINSSIAMKHTTAVTAQRKKLSARYGQNTATECTPRGSKNVSEEATATKTERQHAPIPDITLKEDMVTETEPFCALVQAMLYYSPGDADSTTAWAAPDVPHR